MVEGAEFSDEQLLGWATAMESHPDNLAAALHGGFTVAWLDDAQVPGSVRLEPHRDVHVVLALPTEEVPTTKAREALPAEIDHAAATHNVARSALLVHAMTNDPSLLQEATSDRLHQRARAGVYPQALSLMDALREAGLAAAISGAGPAVLVLAGEPNAAERAAAVAQALDSSQERWTVRAIPISPHGAREVPVEV